MQNTTKLNNWVEQCNEQGCELGQESCIQVEEPCESIVRPLRKHQSRKQKGENNPQEEDQLGINNQCLGMKSLTLAHMTLMQEENFFLYFKALLFRQR